MKRSPERRAWLILFTALFTCCGLTVGVPTAVLAFVNNATAEATANLKLQSGILQYYSQFETTNDAKVVSLDGRTVSEGGNIFLPGPESVGLLTINVPSEPNPVVTFQLYPNANVRIDRLRVPRFKTSLAADDLAFHMSSGRMQVSVDMPSGRKFRLRIIGDHGDTTIDTNGIYFFEETDAETRVEVTRGAATVSTLKGDKSFNFHGGDRTAVADDTGIVGILPPYRNLIRDSEFQGPLRRDWSPIKLTDTNNPVSGTVNAVSTGASNILSFERIGTNLGWGRTGISQTVNADVHDRKPLLLRVNFQIVEQEIPVCGGKGSECPFILRIDYTNRSGADVYRIKGFYGRGTPSSDKLPDYVVTNNQGNHVFRQLGVPSTFEWNLTDLLPEMQTIKSVSVYAEGHKVRTQVSSVELLLQD